MAATPEIDALIVEIKKYRRSNIPEPIIQDIDSTYIPAWESITTGGAGNPAPPDTSVQFNDGGVFGGSAFFTFLKTRGEVNILSAQSSGSVVDLNSLTIKFTQSGTGRVTGAASGILIQPFVYGGNQFDKYYGIHIQQQPWFGTDHTSYNIFSEGDNSANRFQGHSGFDALPAVSGGTAAANPATALLCGNEGGFQTFCFRAKGYFDYSFFENFVDMRNHVAIGGTSAAGYPTLTSPQNVLLVSETFTGNLNAGPYSGVNIGVIFTPSAGTPTTYGIQTLNRPLTSGNFNNAIGGLFKTSFDSAGTVGAIFGAVGLAQMTTGTLTAHMVGISAEVNYQGGDTSGAGYIAGLQTSVVTGGNVPITYGVYIPLILDPSVTVDNIYGLWISEQTAGTALKYNIYSDNPNGDPFGKNFFGAGCQLGSTGTNISEFAAGVVGIGTGARGSVAGGIRAATAGINGALSGAEKLTVTGDGSISGQWLAGTVGIAGAVTGGEKLTVTGSGSISANWHAGAYFVGATAGVDGTFTTADVPAKTVSVSKGIVTSIV